MTNYIELTRPDDSVILINKNTIGAIYSCAGQYCTNGCVVVYSGGNKQQVKESYDTVKSLLG